MGVLDFLKVSVVDKRERPKAAAHAGARVTVDSRAYPIASIGVRGFSVDGFDGSLIAGQRAKVTVSVDEPNCRFNLPLTVEITEVKGTRMTAEFGVLSPETEQLLKRYAEIRKTRR